MGDEKKEEEDGLDRGGAKSVTMKPEGPYRPHKVIN